MTCGMTARAFCLSCQLRCISCWHLELIIADLVILCGFWLPPLPPCIGKYWYGVRWVFPLKGRGGSHSHLVAMDTSLLCLRWSGPCSTWNQYPSSSIGDKFNNLWGLHSSSYMYHTKAQLHQLPPSTKIWLERDWGTSSHAKDFKFTTYGISTVIAYNTGFTVNTLPGTSIWSDP